VGGRGKRGAPRILEDMESLRKRSSFLRGSFRRIRRIVKKILNCKKIKCSSCRVEADGENNVESSGRNEGFKGQETARSAYLRATIIGLPGKTMEFT